MSMTLAIVVLLVITIALGLYIRKQPEGVEAEPPQTPSEGTPMAKKLNAVPKVKQPAVELDRPTVTVTKKAPKEGWGAPLLKTSSVAKLPVTELKVGDVVWTVGPHGRRLMTVDTVHASKAWLRDEDYEAEAFLDPFYLTEQQAIQLNAPRAAWRLRKVTNPDRPTGQEDWGYQSSDHETWVLENSFLGLQPFRNQSGFYEGFQSETVQNEPEPSAPSTDTGTFKTYGDYLQHVRNVTAASEPPPAETTSPSDFETISSPDPDPEPDSSSDDSSTDDSGSGSGDSGSD